MSPPPRPLSELEGICLGLVARNPHGSAYDLRNRLADSPSTQWSASAGAIYPLLRRLERDGYVRASADRAHPRQRRGLVITASGRAALRRWFGPPLPPMAVTVAHDPLRARAAVLDNLPARSRSAWLRAALASLDQVEAMVEAWHVAHAGEPCTDVLTDAGRRDVAARRAWLRAALESNRPPAPIRSRSEP